MKNWVVTFKARGRKALTLNLSDMKDLRKSLTRKSQFSDEWTLCVEDFVKATIEGGLDMSITRQPTRVTLRNRKTGWEFVIEFDSVTLKEEFEDDIIWCMQLKYYFK